ncbi:MAG: hypothetical protein LBS31_03160 [Candidatus Adiutrix sp.]|jgi:hypothetical protein|nr:hypothetical protein [Candidatus Adiutrix sp.]
MSDADETRAAASAQAVLARVDAYFQAAGLSAEEAALETARLRAELAPTAEVDLDLMLEAARQTLAPRLPKAVSRPLRLGHMLAADFQRPVRRAEPKL